MKFRPVSCETSVVILCLVFVIGIVAVEKTEENGEPNQQTKSSPIDLVSRSGSEHSSSESTHSSEKADSSSKRGLETSMAYPQGYFPPYQSNEMHLSVTPPYSRDYGPEGTTRNKQIYFDTSIATSPAFLTHKPSMGQPMVQRRPLYSKYGYLETTPDNIHSNIQGSYNNDRQFPNPASVVPYSDQSSYRPAHSVQPVADYPENSYPSYVYGYDPRTNYQVHTPSYQSSYQPTYETLRGQSGIEYENRYRGTQGGYNNPAYNNPNSPTLVSYEQEGQPIDMVHRYNSQPSQIDRKPTIEYKLQVLRELEEQRRRLVQEINDQASGSLQYQPSTPATIQRRMVPHISMRPITNPREYFFNQQDLTPKFQSFGSGTTDGTFLMGPSIMRTKMPYLADGQSSYPLNDPQRSNFEVRTSYLMPKSKRDNEMVATSCGESVAPGMDDNIAPCSVMNPLADAPILQGNFWDYFELESSKHLIYHHDVTPPVFNPVDMPPLLPDGLPPCVEGSLCDENTEPIDVDYDLDVKPVVPLPDDDNDDWDHKPTQHFNTSCGNTSKPQNQADSKDEQKITSTTSSPTTLSTATEDATPVSSTSESTDHDSGDDADKTKEVEQVVEDKTELITFPDPLLEDDENQDDNEAIYQINPRRAGE